MRCEHPLRIDWFAGRWAFLSNFHPSPLSFRGRLYPTAEHAYQAAKTSSPELAQAIRRAATPDLAKALGSRLTPRAEWPWVRIATMRRVLRAKFTGSPALLEALLATGEAELVEGNDWGDRFWGVSGGEGDNHLGRLLMSIREELGAHRHIA